MIKKNKDGNFILKCENHYECCKSMSASATFREMIDYKKKSNNWNVVKSIRWLDLCNDCYRKYVKNLGLKEGTTFSVQNDYQGQHYYRIECTKCGDDYNEKFFSYEEAIEFKKQNFKIVKKGFEIQNLCKNCLISSKILNIKGGLFEYE